MVAGKVRKRREVKPQYKATPREIAALDKVRAAEKIPLAMVSRSKNGERLVLDHPEPEVGAALLLEAIGSTDDIFLNGLLRQHPIAPGNKTDVERINFMFSVVNGIKPQDQIEAMLGAQLAAVQEATMRLSKLLADADDIKVFETAERAYNRLTRTLIGLVDALKRHRTGGEQKVTVQYVNVSEGGQAIVGNVTQGRRRGKTNGSVAPPLSLAHDQTQPMQIVEDRKPVPARNNKTKK